MPCRYAPQEYAEVPAKGKGLVILALQLLWKAEQLNWDACRGTPGRGAALSPPPWPTAHIYLL
jgi:hypothetical protein